MKDSNYDLFCDDLAEKENLTVFSNEQNKTCKTCETCALVESEQFSHGEVNHA